MLSHCRASDPKGWTLLYQGRGLCCDGRVLAALQASAHQMPVPQCPPSWDDQYQAFSRLGHVSVDKGRRADARGWEPHSCPLSLPHWLALSPLSLITGLPFSKLKLWRKLHPHSFPFVAAWLLLCVEKPQSTGLFSLGPSHHSPALLIINREAGGCATWNAGASLSGARPSICQPLLPRLSSICAWTHSGP